MTHPLPATTAIVTQWVRAERLFEMRAHTSTPLEDPIWVSDGDEHPDSNGVRTTTSHLLLNVTGYEDDHGRYIELEFPDGTPRRRVALDEVIEVHSIRPGRDLIEGRDPRPDLPRTRGAR
jgi:hypothetical protein